MPIVGGLDIHRRQITFDYLDTVTGQVCRGQISPADREHLRAWLARFAGRDDVAFAVEGCAGWRYVTEELAAAGITAHLAEPADTAARRGRKRHAKTDKTDARHLRMLLAEGRLPEWRSRPGTSWSAGRCWSCTTTCAASAPPRRSCAVLFHQGAPVLAEGALRTGKGVAELRAAAAGCLSPAGQLQVATALEVIDALEARLHVVRHQLTDAARHLAGAKALAARLYGVGPVTALAITCWLAGAGRFSSSRKAVRFAGPGHHRVLLGPQGPAREAVPAGTAGAALGRLGGRQDPRPHLRPGPPVLRRGQGPQEQQARLPVRGPQDPPPSPSHPGRARRRRARRRLTHRHGDQHVTAAPRPAAAELTDGDHRGQLPPIRCQPLPASTGQADGLIRPSGRIPAGGDTQSIIMSPGQPKPRGPR